MTLYFNLHRFGVDEDAIGRFINGDLPADDLELAGMIDVPGWHIERMLDEHERAQRILRERSKDGRPFVLFLRSFASEQHSVRGEGNVASSFSLVSLQFQRDLALYLESRGVAIVKLHGGTDGFMASHSPSEANVLSTDSDNWKGVVSELIAGASAIVFMLGDVSPGVSEEIELIRALGREEVTIVVIPNANAVGTGRSDLGDAWQVTESPETVDKEQVREALDGFPHVEDLQGEGMSPEVQSILERGLAAELPEVSFEAAEAARFTYLEPSFVGSQPYVDTKGRLWQSLRMMRALLDKSYWAALAQRDVPVGDINLTHAQIEAHRLFGLAIATADYRAMTESLAHMGTLFLRHRSGNVGVTSMAAGRIEKLAERIFEGPAPETEGTHSDGPDLLSLPKTKAHMAQLFQLAAKHAQGGDIGLANYLYHVSAIAAVSMPDVEDEHERSWILANLCRDWANFQAGASMANWGIANTRFAVALCRELVEHDADQYLPGLAMCLNNLGSHCFKRKQWDDAEAAWRESIAIRRARPVESEMYAFNLRNSLANLGFLRAELEDFDGARSVYLEALDVGTQHGWNDPGAASQQVRIECWLSLSLAKIPGESQAAAERARQAAAHLAKLRISDPASAAPLEPLVELALRGE